MTPKETEKQNHDPNSDSEEEKEPLFKRRYEKFKQRSTLAKIFIVSLVVTGIFGLVMTLYYSWEAFVTASGLTGLGAGLRYLPSYIKGKIRGE